ncbi:NADH pyrophosphatase [Chromobacterium violaceum]|uniref:NADH pyrophosphatase n=1 Tax=Chromobacterium violaceum TaxID=536 RepID=A0A3S5DLN9_CHRVL|nr:NADH pyrophosphatase [Chromobacterium violaceum]
MAAAAPGAAGHAMAQVQAAARAAQLRQFFHSHRFCGHCATPLAVSADQLGRHCPSCGQVYYPRISPP